MSDAKYIGGGLYATNYGYQIELRLGYHENEPAVYLEPEVYRELVKYAESVWQLKKDPMSDFNTHLTDTEKRLSELAARVRTLEERCKIHAPIIDPKWDPISGELVPKIPPTPSWSRPSPPPKSAASGGGGSGAGSGGTGGLTAAPTENATNTNGESASTATSRETSAPSLPVPDEPVPRYKVEGDLTTLGGYPCTRETPDRQFGEWVRYKDHEAKLAALKARHAAEVGEMRAEIERLTKELASARAEQPPPPVTTVGAKRYRYKRHGDIYSLRANDVVWNHTDDSPSTWFRSEDSFLAAIARGELVEVDTKEKPDDK